MLSSTVGQILFNEKLPAPLRDYHRVLDKKAVRELLDQAAQSHAGSYSDIVQHMHNLGAEAAQADGATLSLDALIPPPIVTQAMTDLRAQVNKLVDNPKLKPEEKNEQIRKLVFEATGPIEKMLYESAVKQKNPFAIQVLSGARGGKADLRSLLAGDMLVTDHKDRIIDMPILHGYAEGLDPAEYWACAYASRKGSVSAKLGTAKGGFLSKQLHAAAHRMVVTDHDCGTANGIPVPADDMDNVGAVLARDVGSFKAGSVISSRMLSNLKGQTINVRSPMTCQAQRGVCQKCTGLRESGGFPELGAAVGLTAAGALCLAEGTLVQMADGARKPIESIVAGDVVLGSTVDGQLRPTRVLGATASGIKACLRTRFRLGSGKVTRENILELVSTGEHKLLSLVTKRESNKVRPDARGLCGIAARPVAGSTTGFTELRACLSRSFDDTGLKDEPFALLYGLLIGDGSYTAAVTETVKFSCYDPKLVQDIQSYLSGLGIKLGNQTTGEYYLSDVTTHERKFRSDGSWYCNRLVEGLRAEAMRGAGSGTKQLPRNVYGWSNRSVSALLSGLFATDGWVGADQAGYASTSFRLIFEIRQLLGLRFGVRCSSVGSSSKAREDGSMYVPCYRISVTGRDNLLALASAIAPPGVKLERTLALRHALEGKRGNTASQCHLIDQVAVGELPTYDLWVDHPDHLFVLANGLVVSNSEPVTQSLLSVKHSGGRAKSLKRELPTFDQLNQMVQVPSSFANAATLAKVDGVVQDIEDAPQGGKIIKLGGESHYVPSDLAPTVKVGDRIEAGDTLSEGVPNPAEIVQHKGIGEGRRSFVEHFMKIFKDAGINANRRNVELLSRGLINHVRVTGVEGTEHGLPGDIVEYASLANGYTPRHGFQVLAPRAAIGNYLEQPALHYTIGTRVTKRVADQMHTAGIPQITVHEEAPAFHPEMIRAMENLSQSKDWQIRLGGSYLEKGLLDSTHRGLSSTRSESYIPGMAQGAGFGQHIADKGIY